MLKQGDLASQGASASQHRQADGGHHARKPVGQHFMEPWRHNTQHNDIQNNDPRHNGLVCDTRYKRHSA